MDEVWKKNLDLILNLVLNQWGQKCSVVIYGFEKLGGEKGKEVNIII